MKAAILIEIEYDPTKSKLEPIGKQQYVPVKEELWENLKNVVINSQEELGITYWKLVNEAK